MAIQDKTITLITRVIQQADRGGFPYNIMISSALLTQEALEKLENLLSQYQDLSLLNLNKYLLTSIEEAESNKDTDEKDIWQSLMDKDKEDKASALFECVLKEHIELFVTEVFDSEDSVNFLNTSIEKMRFVFNSIKYLDAGTLLDQIVAKIAISVSPPSTKELLEREVRGFPISTQFIKYAGNKWAVQKHVYDKCQLLAPLKRAIILDELLLHKIEANPKESEPLLHKGFVLRIKEKLLNSREYKQSDCEILKTLHSQLDTLHKVPSNQAEPKQNYLASIRLSQ